MPSNRVPPPLKQLLQLDQKLTKKLCDGADRVVPGFSNKYRFHMKGLELSCHGIPWFAFTLISIYLITSEEAREIEINLLFGLIFDIMVVAFVKACTRRARPPQNRSDDILSITYGPDKFSFPSGHATRAVFLALFFTQWAFPDMSPLLVGPIFLWAGSVAASRVFLRRHHILDVLAGVVIGYFEFIFIGFMWVGPFAARWLGDFIATTSEDESPY